MNVRWTWTALPLIALAADVVVQLVTFRARGRRDPWQSVLFGFAAGLVVVILGSLRLAGPTPTGDAMAWSLMNVVSFAALGYGYFAFVNLNFTSLRIRFFRELLRFDHPVSARELLAAYDGKEALRLRLQRLLDKRQLVERVGRYYVNGTTSFLLLAYVLDGLKWLILRRPFGRGVQTP